VCKPAVLKINQGVVCFVGKRYHHSHLVCLPMNKNGSSVPVLATLSPSFHQFSFRFVFPSDTFWRKFFLISTSSPVVIVVSAVVPGGIPSSIVVVVVVVVVVVSEQSIVSWSSYGRIVSNNGSNELE